MANPIYGLFNQQSLPQGGIGNMLQQLTQFRQNLQGDARAQVQNLLNSGRMTQAQYNHLSQLATQIQDTLKKM